jgi:hypothetical protein
VTHLQCRWPAIPFELCQITQLIHESSVQEDSVKVLIATTQTAATQIQGAWVDDFSTTVEGELVFDPGPCSKSIRERDPSCPCAFSYRGLASGGQTTTCMVADLDLGLSEYMRAFRDGLTRVGVCTECARQYAHAARMLALRWPVGTVRAREYLDIRQRISR